MITRPFGFFALFILISTSLIADNTYLRLSPKVVETRVQQMNVAAPEQRVAALKKAMQEAGCPMATIVEQTVPGSSPNTVMCTLPGTEPGMIIISAAIDYRSKGDELTVDNATLEMLPLLVQSLSGTKHRLSMVFIAFTGEKKQEGSKYYLSQLSEDQRKSIRGMIFLDQLGRSPMRYLHPSQWNSPGVHELLASDPFGASGSVGSRNTAHDPTALNKWLDVSARAMKLDYPAELSEFYFTHALSFEHKRIIALTLTSPAYMVLQRPREPVKMPSMTVDMATYYESYNLICIFLLNLDAQLKGK